MGTGCSTSGCSASLGVSTVIALVTSRLHVATAVATEAAAVTPAVTAAAFELLISGSSGIDSGNLTGEESGCETSSAVSPFLLAVPLRPLDFFGVLALTLPFFLGVSGTGESAISTFGVGVKGPSSESAARILLITMCVSGSIISFEEDDVTDSGVGIRPV